MPPNDEWLLPDEERLAADGLLPDIGFLRRPVLGGMKTVPPPPGLRCPGYPPVLEPEPRLSEVITAKIMTIMIMATKTFTRKTMILP